MKPTVMRANPDEDNYLLESRVRENCMHGSVGGEDVSPSLPNQFWCRTEYVLIVNVDLPAQSGEERFYQSHRLNPCRK